MTRKFYLFKQTKKKGNKFKVFEMWYSRKASKMKKKQMLRLNNGGKLIAEAFINF